MQVQAPVHVAFVKVGRGHRQLPSELDLPFSSSPTVAAKAGTRGSLQPSFPEFFTFSVLCDIFAYSRLKLNPVRNLFERR